MDSTIKHSAKYLIGIVVFLVMSALYFFILADGNQKFDSEYVLKLIDDNKSLEIDVATMALQNKEDQATIAALQDELMQKNELIESVQLGETAGGTAVCNETDDMVSAQKSLIETQGKYIACSAALNEHKVQLSELSASNALLVSSAELSQGAAQERDVLQNQLAVMSVEYNALEAQIGTVMNQNEQLTSTLVKLQPLAFTDFSLTPSYCEKEFDDGWACVSSIDIVAKLSYNPAAEMVVRLIDPNGDVVARRSVQGREVNNLQFLSSENTPLLTGDYSVRFEIDNLFDEVVPFKLSTVSAQASL